MHQLTSIPRYLVSFSCVGPSCPDTCCSGWDIHVDQPTQERWHTLRLHKEGPPLAARTRSVRARADGHAADDPGAVVERTPHGRLRVAHGREALRRAKHAG